MFNYLEKSTQKFVLIKESRGGLIMRLTNRDFINESDDFNKMFQFIIEDNNKKKDNFSWSIGRIVDWKYGLWREKKFFPNFFRKNAHLWFDYFGNLVGFAISEYGDNSFYIFTVDEYPFLYEEILNWVKDNWKDREDILCTEIPETETLAINVLENNGFISKGICEVTRAFDCSKSIGKNINLPEGYTYSNMKENYDPIGLRKLQLNAFRKQNNISEIDILAAEYARESPIYKPEFDMSIVNENGMHVAGCEAFINYVNNTAEIERVCTHSEYRQMGFGKKILTKCIQELSKHGIKRAYITGMSDVAISLYGKLGHENEVKGICYELSK